MDRIDRASALEAELIRALFVLYDKDSIADPDEQIRLIWPLCVR